MREHHDNPNARRTRANADPLARAGKRDRARILERDHARELRAETRAATLDRFWDRRYA